MSLYQQKICVFSAMIFLTARRLFLLQRSWIYLWSPGFSYLFTVVAVVVLDIFTKSWENLIYSSYIELNFSHVGNIYHSSTALNLSKNVVDGDESSGCWIVLRTTSGSLLLTLLQGPERTDGCWDKPSDACSDNAANGEEESLDQELLFEGGLWSESEQVVIFSIRSAVTDLRFLRDSFSVDASSDWYFFFNWWSRVRLDRPTTVGNESLHCKHWCSNPWESCTSCLTL